jgi:cell division protein FtsL
MSKIKEKTIDIENASKEILAFHKISPEKVGDIARKYNLEPEFLVKILGLRL